MTFQSSSAWHVQERFSFQFLRNCLKNFRILSNFFVQLEFSISLKNFWLKSNKVYISQTGVYIILKHHSRVEPVLERISRARKRVYYYCLVTIGLYSKINMKHEERLGWWKSSKYVLSYIVLVTDVFHSFCRELIWRVCGPLSAGTFPRDKRSRVTRNTARCSRIF